jgi:hypothetical protein
MRTQRMVAAVIGLALMNTAAMAQTYTVSVSPSLNTVKVGDCLYFSGTVTLNGRPVSGVRIGVEDPMKQQSIASAATTDSTGKFKYYPENMCPAKYNDMVGTFEFKFFAGSTTAKSRVTVNTKSPNGLDLLSVKNTGTATYKVNLKVGGTDKGTTIVAPGKNLTLFNSSAFNNSTMIATVMDNAGRTLWKATFNDTPSSTTKSTTFLNPYYNNFWVNSTVSINGSSKSRSFNGIQKVYTDYVNKEWNVGSKKVAVGNNVTQGVSTEGALGITGTGCETFLGLRGSCSLSCDASVGLGITACFGLCIPIGPVDLGCGFKCSAEVASVSCQVASISASASATYR